MQCMERELYFFLSFLANKWKKTVKIILKANYDYRVSPSSNEERLSNH